MSTIANSVKPAGFMEAVRQALDEAMAADESVVLLGEDVSDTEGGGVFGASMGLSTKYGDRVRSTPIAEQAIMGAAIGAALAGMRPVAEIMIMNFITVAMDQLCNHAAKLRYMSGGRTGVPITVRTTGFGAGAAAQHSDLLEAWLCHVPGLKVVMPSDPFEAKGLLLSCIFDDDPCVVVESPLIGPPAVLATPGERIPLGKANIRRTGSDVTVIGYGSSIGRIDPVAATFDGEGLSVEVIDLRTVSPLDMDTVLESVAKTRRAVVVHESVKNFGVGAEVSAGIHEALFSELAAPVQRVAAPFVPVPFSPPLVDSYTYRPADIEAAVRRTVE